MANVRNYEEYRAEVLERLGDDYTVEDLRNTERWRLRVLDMLSGGGSGGGGSSDFSTAEVTIATTRRLGANYSLSFSSPYGNNYMSAIINTDGSLNFNDDQKTVSVNKPDTHNILFTKNGYIDIYTPTPENITVEGNGEVITDDEGNFARAYGECTITIN